MKLETTLEKLKACINVFNIAQHQQHLVKDIEQQTTLTALKIVKTTNKYKDNAQNFFNKVNKQHNIFT